MGNGICLYGENVCQGRVQMAFKQTAKIFLQNLFLRVFFSFKVNAIYVVKPMTHQLH